MNPMIKKGTVFPKMNSIRRMGVTITCSMVPISFSRTMAMDVSIKQMTMSMTAMRPGT